MGSPVLALEHRKLKSPVLGYSIAQVHLVFYVGTAASKLRRPCRSLRLLLYRAISSSADEVGVDESRVTNVASSSGCPSCSWGTVWTRKSAGFQRRRSLQRIAEAVNVDGTVCAQGLNAGRR